LPTSKLQLMEKRERQRKDYNMIVRDCPNKGGGHDLLNKSDAILRPQSIRNTSFELKVLHASSSGDQLTETWLPHQKVSRKNVVTMAHTVNTDTT